MRISLRTGIGGLLLAGAVGLTACDGGGDPVQQAVREASAAHQAAALKDGAVTTTVRPAATDGDQALVTGMIEQHRAGMAAADAALAQSSDPEVRRMARSIKDRQMGEIAELQAWKPAAE
ncbi:MAG: hypothetical protein ACI9YM_002003 [Brevundimonas sp.]|jgi:uncharacterized protein (DUF305 family)|uniref:DUF305 domain-containing protein n=1 Tax=Brevundimonas sp. TaxID=1871086 RepID=UPI0039E4F3BD